MNARADALSDRIATVLADRFDAVYPQIRSRHGTLNRYRKWGCRCTECRRASADHRKRMRANARLREQQTKQAEPSPLCTDDGDAA